MGREPGDWGGGHQEATSSTVVSVAGSAGFLVAAGEVCPHLASVTVLPEKSILVPPSQGLVRTGGSGHLGLVKEASGTRENIRASHSLASALQ